MRLRLFLLVVLGYGIAALIAVMLPVWRNPVRVQSLTLTGRPVTVRLRKLARQQFIHTIQLRVEGRAAGRLVVRQLLTPTASGGRVDTVSSAFRLEYGGDWYQSDCYLRFEPLPGTSGPVRISYKFLDI